MRRFFLQSLWIVALCAATGLHAGAVIEGELALPPTAPPPANQRYQLKAGEVGRPEPRTAVVYLEGDLALATTTDGVKPAAVVPQKSYQFLSGLTPVQKGTTVEFPNQDNDFHNVFSYSKPKRFDLGRYRRDEKAPTVTFDQPGVVKLYCEIHEHMRATILVLDTPHFVKTTPEGRFRLENLPAGKFTLKAWLDEKTVLERPVELKEGERLKVDFGQPVQTPNTRAISKAETHRLD